MKKDYQVPELKFKSCDIPEVLNNSFIDLDAVNDCEMSMAGFLTKAE